MQSLNIHPNCQVDCIQIRVDPTADLCARRDAGYRFFSLAVTSKWNWYKGGYSWVKTIWFHFKHFTYKCSHFFRLCHYLGTLVNSLSFSTLIQCSISMKYQLVNVPTNTAADSAVSANVLKAVWKGPATVIQFFKWVAFKWTNLGWAMARRPSMYFSQQSKKVVSRSIFICGISHRWHTRHPALIYSILNGICSQMLRRYLGKVRSYLFSWFMSHKTTCCAGIWPRRSDLTCVEIFQCDFSWLAVPL